MIKQILVKDIIGDNPNIEEAVILRNIVIESINETDKVVLNFKNVFNIPSTFFSTLITPIRHLFVEDKVNFLNVDNTNNNFTRVYNGTSL